MNPSPLLAAPDPPRAPTPSPRSAADLPAVPGAQRVGLVSDTHGWLDPALLEHFRGVTAIVHAGDVGDPAILDVLATVAPLTAVRGNIDGGPLRDLPLEATLRVGGRRIAALHIAGSPRRPNADARALVRRERPDLLIVGHSHIPAVARLGPDGAPLPPGRVLPGQTLWINPGAAGHQGFHAERDRRRAGAAARRGAPATAAYPSRRARPRRRLRFVTHTPPLYQHPRGAAPCAPSLAAPARPR